MPKFGPNSSTVLLLFKSRSIIGSRFSVVPQNPLTWADKCEAKKNSRGKISNFFMFINTRFKLLFINDKILILFIANLFIFYDNVKKMFHRITNNIKAIAINKIMRVTATFIDKMI